MIENYNQDNRKKKRDRIKQRIQVTVDEENYEYYPFAGSCLCFPHSPH